MAQDDTSAFDEPCEEVKNHSFAPARRVGEDRSVPVKLAGPLAATHVIHSILGRVRLRVPALKTNSDLARGLRALLSAQAGVTEVTVAPACHSVTVVHDPLRWTPEALCMFLQSRNGEELDQYESAALPDDATRSFAKTWLQPWRYLNTHETGSGSSDVRETDGSVKSGYWKVGYVSMVVGVVLFAVPGVPGVPFLILSSYCFSKATILKTGDEPGAGGQVLKAGQ